jgi:mitogen-activated protein kinase kinase kinase
MSSHCDSSEQALTHSRIWEEERVAEWLRSINCSQYVSLFLKNNITGSNLMELDAASLKEMGILKMGDRKRIEAQAKKFRASEYKRISKRVTNRVRIQNDVILQVETDRRYRNHLLY